MYIYICVCTCLIIYLYICRPYIYIYMCVWCMIGCEQHHCICIYLDTHFLFLFNLCLWCSLQDEDVHVCQELKKKNKISRLAQRTHYHHNPRPKPMVRFKNVGCWLYTQYMTTLWTWRTSQAISPESTANGDSGWFAVASSI